MRPAPHRDISVMDPRRPPVQDVHRAMKPVVLAGSGNPQLAAAIAGAMGVPVGSAIVDRFPDEELHVELQEDVRERDV